MKKQNETTIYMTGAVLAVIAAIVFTTQFGRNDDTASKNRNAGQTDTIQTSQANAEDETKSTVGLRSDVSIESNSKRN